MTNDKYFLPFIAFFSGNKMSGFGREKGQEALYSYVRTKNVAIRVAGE